MNKRVLSAFMVSLSLFLSLSAPAANFTIEAGESPRIGDPESVFDPAKFDERFPDAKLWAACGVEGGIPHRASLPVVATLKPGDDINAAVAKAGKGVVLLGEGTWKVADTITLRSNVVIRGAGMDKTKLEFHRKGSVMFGKGIERFGVEDLSVEGAPVGGAKMGDGIAIDKCKNGWVQNVRISRTAWRPMRIGDSSHITCRDNIAEFALDQASGNGYYEILLNSTDNLFYNETLFDLRHICIHYAGNRAEGPHRNVFIHLNLIDTDINMHGSDGGKNLFESCVVDCTGHGWVPLSHGISRFDVHHPGLEGNVFHRLSTLVKDGSTNAVYGHGNIQFPDNADGSFLYGIRSVWSYPLIYPLVQEPPRSGTLYPVTGVHRTLPGQKIPDLVKRIAVGPLPAWPASPKQAQRPAAVSSIAELFADCPFTGVPTDAPGQRAFRSWLRARNEALSKTILTITGTYNNGTGNISSVKTPGFAFASISPPEATGILGGSAAVTVICAIPTSNNKPYHMSREQKGEFTAKGRITALECLPMQGKSMVWVEMEGTEADNPPPSKSGK